jgi:hypothetical protein
VVISARHRVASILLLNGSVSINMISKASAEHNEGVLEPELNSEHEALLPGVMALANLFSNTVEAFGLIRASQRWEREEQLLLSRLGIQQARLLIWGDILGVSSPPSSVTNQAVPKHPSAAYPDLKEPTFFAPRDARLDEPNTRQQVEDALSSIVDRSAHTTRDEMMEKFGLKPPKRFTPDYQPALDTTRLEAFREKYELLKEVAETYAHINSRRTNSIVMQSWTISDRTKFASFILLTQEKIDFLVSSMGVSERVDRAMRMDIRNFGWHITADRARIVSSSSSKTRAKTTTRNTSSPPRRLWTTSRARAAKTAALVALSATTHTPLAFPLQSQKRNPLHPPLMAMVTVTATVLPALTAQATAKVLRSLTQNAQACSADSLSDPSATSPKKKSPNPSPTSSALAATPPQSNQPPTPTAASQTPAR